MPFNIDLHVHTLFSGDNEADPREMAEAAIERGLDGIAFTEHYSYEASGYADRLGQDYAGKLQILRGVELSADEGHCLVFGVNTDRLMLGGEPVKDIVKVVRELGGVAIPSHPFRRGSGIGDMVSRLEGIHAIEGYNGCNLHPMNMLAIKASRDLGLPFTGGSDAHSPREVGACYTAFRSPVDEDTLIEALVGGDYTGYDTRKISRTVPMP